MHNYVCKKLPFSFDNQKIIFKHNYEVQDSHQTRQSNLLFIEKCNSVFASKQPYFTFPVMWNKWIPIIPDFTPRNNLKSQLKGYVLSHYANSKMLKQILQRLPSRLKLSKHLYSYIDSLIFVLLVYVIICWLGPIF